MPSLFLWILSGYNNHDHSNAKNVKGDPASGPNRPEFEQTNATSDIHVSPDGRFLQPGGIDLRLLLLLNKFSFNRAA